MGSNGKRVAQVKTREVTREYDLNEMPQTAVAKLRSQMGHILEDARELEGHRKCSNGEMNLDAVIDVASRLETRLADLKEMTRACTAVCACE